MAAKPEHFVKVNAPENLGGPPSASRKQKSNEKRADKKVAVHRAPGLYAGVLDASIAMLQSAGTRLTKLDSKSSESLGGSCGPAAPVWTFPPEVLSAAKSMLGPKLYSFRVAKQSTLTSGAGVMNINIATDLTTYGEGACLIALFTECRLRRSAITLVPAFVAGTANFSYLIGFVPEVTTSATSASNVARLPNCSQETTYTAFPRTFTFASSPNRVWGWTGDEGVAAPRIVSGFNGTWQVANNGGTPATTTLYFSYYLVAMGQFRSRS